MKIIAAGLRSGERPFPAEGKQVLLNALVLGAGEHLAGLNPADAGTLADDVRASVTPRQRGQLFTCLAGRLAAALPDAFDPKLLSGRRRLTGAMARLASPCSPADAPLPLGPAELGALFRPDEQGAAELHAALCILREVMVAECAATPDGLSALEQLAKDPGEGLRSETLDLLASLVAFGGPRGAQGPQAALMRAAARVEPDDGPDAPARRVAANCMLLAPALSAVANGPTPTSVKDCERRIIDWLRAEQRSGGNPVLTQRWAGRERDLARWMTLPAACFALTRADDASALRLAGDLARHVAALPESRMMPPEDGTDCRELLGYAAGRHPSSAVRRALLTGMFPGVPDCATLQRGFAMAVCAAGAAQTRAVVDDLCQWITDPGMSEWRELVLRLLTHAAGWMDPEQETRVFEALRRIAAPAVASGAATASDRHEPAPQHDGGVMTVLETLAELVEANPVASRADAVVAVALAWVAANDTDVAPFVRKRALQALTKVLPFSSPDPAANAALHLLEITRSMEPNPRPAAADALLQTVHQRTRRGCEGASAAARYDDVALRRSVAALRAADAQQAAREHNGGPLAIEVREAIAAAMLSATPRFPDKALSRLFDDALAALRHRNSIARGLEAHEELMDDAVFFVQQDFLPAAWAYQLVGQDLTLLLGLAKRDIKREVNAEIHLLMRTLPALLRGAPPLPRAQAQRLDEAADLLLTTSRSSWQRNESAVAVRVAVSPAWLAAIRQGAGDGYLARLFSLLPDDEAVQAAAAAGEAGRDEFCRQLVARATDAASPGDSRALRTDSVGKLAAYWWSRDPERARRLLRGITIDLYGLTPDTSRWLLFGRIGTHRQEAFEGTFMHLPQAARLWVFELTLERLEEATLKLTLERLEETALEPGLERFARGARIRALELAIQGLRDVLAAAASTLPPGVLAPYRDRLHTLAGATEAQQLADRAHTIITELS